MKSLYKFLGFALLFCLSCFCRASAQTFQPPSPVTQCSVGARVQLNSDINVCDGSGNIIGKQFTGTLGTITRCSIGTDGSTWWRVDYETGVDGWAKKNYTNYFIAPYPQLPLIVGDKEIIMTKAQRDVKGLNFWPDNTMGVLKSGSTYMIWTSNGSSVAKTVGTLNNPLSVSVALSQIQNMKHTYNYFAGGPVYKDPATGMLIMIYHAEKNITDLKNFWSLLSMAESHGMI